jgi:DNA-binding NtrC family response regulator
VDVRILAATHRDLEAAIAQREFREDLYYRISVVTITLPPLSARPEDIPELARYFIRRYAHDAGVESPALRPEALTFLQAQSWPGNVRELENTLRQALLAARPFPIGLEHVQQALTRARKPISVAQQPHAAYIQELLSRAQSGDLQNARDRMIADLDAELFQQAIRLAHGNQAKAARWLGVTRAKMRETLTALGLHPARDRAADPAESGSGP